MNVAAQIRVAGGLVTGYRGIRFGGLACVPADASRPARIRLAVWHAAADCDSECDQHRDSQGHPAGQRRLNGQGHPDGQRRRTSGRRRDGHRRWLGGRRWAGGRRGVREFDAELREGDTFRVAGQTWRLDAIHDAGQFWHADLTRVTP